MAYSKEVKKQAEKYLVLYDELCQSYEDNYEAFDDLLRIISDDFSNSYSFRCKLVDYITFVLKSKMKEIDKK